MIKGRPLLLVWHATCSDVVLLSNRNIRSHDNGKEEGELGISLSALGLLTVETINDVPQPMCIVKSVHAYQHISFNQSTPEFSATH